MLAVCPECQRTITTEESGWQTCKFCHRRIWIPDPLDPDAPPPDDPAATRTEIPPDAEAAPPADPIEIPWESTNSRSTVSNFLLTVYRSMFEHNRFFRSVGDSEVSMRTRLFGVVVLTVGLASYFQIQSFSLTLLHKMQDIGSLKGSTLPFIQEMLANMEKMKVNEHFFLISTILSPLFAVAILWFTSRLVNTGFFLSRRIFPVPQNRIQRLVIYSYTPWLFLIVPVVGIVWALLIQFFAFRKGLGFSRFAAVTTVFLNLIFLNLCYNVWIEIHAMILV